MTSIAEALMYPTTPSGNHLLLLPVWILLLDALLTLRAKVEDQEPMATLEDDLVAILVMSSVVEPAVEMVGHSEVKANPWMLTVLVEEPPHVHASTAVPPLISRATVHAKLFELLLMAMLETIRHRQ